MTFTQLLNVMQHGQDVCTGFLPHAEFVHLYQALICGIAIRDGSDRQLFLDSGLIHIMVVSGAHLIFLEHLMARWPHRLRLAILGIYCWLTGFGPPVVKAFFKRAVEALLGRHGWTAVQIEAAAVALTLMIVPQWLLSRSFLMSWSCSLAFCLPALFKPKALDQAVKAYFLLMIFVAASPLTILWNAILAPVVGQLLFPFTLLLIPFPALEPIVAQPWSWFLWLIDIGPKAPPAEWFVPTINLFWVPAVFHAALSILEVRWRRARAFL